MSDDEIDDMVYSHYREEIESWISYYVLPATGRDDKDKD